MLVTAGDYVTDWFSEFVPAIPSRPGVDAGVAERSPEWYALRYMTGSERVLIRLLEFVGIPYHYLTYYQRQPKSKSVRRAWLPGYLFIQFDAAQDRWQQVNRMPAVLDILGDPSPLPPGIVEDLVMRLPEHLAKPSAIACIAPGTHVQITKGVCRGFNAVVLWSDRKHIKVIMMMFGHPSEVMLSSKDVEITG